MKGNSDPITEAIERTVTAAVEQALDRHSRPVQREALRIGEAAQALGLSDRQVRRLIDAGEIPVKRFGDNGVPLIPLAGLREALTA